MEEKQPGIKMDDDEKSTSELSDNLVRTSTEKDETSPNMSQENDCMDIESKSMVRIGNADMPPRKLCRREKITLASMLCSIVLVFMQLSVLAPFYPPEAAKKGMRELVIGLVFSSYSLILFCGSPIIGGKMIPYFGPKPVFVSGCCIAGTSYIIFGLLEFVDHRNMFMFASFVVRLFDGVGSACIITSFFAITLDRYTDHVNFVFGLQQACIGIASTVGPFIGAALYSVGGFKFPLAFFGLLTCMTAPLNLYIIPPNKRKVARPNSKKASLLRLFRIPDVTVVSIVIVISGTIFGFLNPTLQPHISKELDLSTTMIALVFPSLGLAYAVSCYLWSWVADKTGRGDILMSVGMMLCSSILLFLGPSPIFPFMKSEVWSLILLMVLLGCFCAMHLVPTLNHIQKSAINSGLVDNLATYGLISGIWSSCIALGETIGPAYGAALDEYYGFSFASTIQALFCALCGLLTAGLIIFNGTCRKSVQVVSLLSPCKTTRNQVENEETLLTTEL